MKHLLLFVFLITLSCDSPKKVIKVPQKEVTETNKDKTLEDKPNITKAELIAVLKYPNRINDAKQLIENSGLVWDKLIFNQETTKIVLIKVPREKRDFWIERLIKSDEFKTVEINNTATIDKIKEEINSTFVTFKKTPCYGHCPVFEVRIDHNGKVFYTGIKYVLVTGKKEFLLNKKQFVQLKEMLGKTSFSSYKNIYDNTKIADLPSTYISYHKKEIQMRVWGKVPTELVAVCEYIEDILLEKKFYEL